MKRPALIGYVAAVSVLGLGSLTVVPELTPGRTSFLSLEFFVLAAYVTAGEIFPLRVPRAGREGRLTVSTTFAFAILLHLGVAEALVALVAASVASDAFERRAPSKTLFNASQLALSVVAAGAVLHALRPLPASDAVPWTVTGLAVAAIAAGVFFLVNFLLSGAAVALATNTPVPVLLRRDLLPQALWTGMLLSLSPIVVAAADASVTLLPLFVVPMLALYKSMEILLERAHQALHDPLTGLPNRALFADRIAQAVVTAERAGGRSAVMILDIDRFKDVNDTLGHHGGDQVLQLVAERLAAVLPRPDTVARLGGDEFGLIAWPVTATELGATVVSRVRAAVYETARIGELAMNLETSVGVALAPDHGSDADSLVSCAVAALSRAKELGSGWALHEPERFRGSENRMARLQALRHALEDRELVLHYQPQVSVRTGEVEAVEALVRWAQPDAGLVMPDRFIPMAEESGLIRDLTRYVLTSAIEMISTLQREGFPQRVAVNVSARDLQDPLLPDEVAKLLVAAAVDPPLLELEITERTVMSDPAQAADVVRRLHGLGVTVAIDDFGTGNTSLRLLSDLAVDCLKIDRSLVARVAAGGPDAVIVEATINLGHDLGMTVVAEGVETTEVLGRLRALHCDTAQGYLCGRPVPGDVLRTSLAGS